MQFAIGPPLLPHTPATKKTGLITNDQTSGRFFRAPHGVMVFAAKYFTYEDVLADRQNLISRMDRSATNQ